MLISINVYFVEQSNQKVTESQTRLNDFFELFDAKEVVSLVIEVLEINPIVIIEFNTRVD